MEQSQSIEKLKQLISDKKFIEASFYADDVVKDNENSGEAWLLYFLAYNSKSSLDECSPYEYSMNVDLINKIENLGDENLKNDIKKYKEKVNLINNFIEKQSKIKGLSSEINDYAKYAYGHVGENAIKALDCANEIKNNINEIKISANYRSNYIQSPMQVKKAMQEVLNTNILDDVNKFLDYKKEKMVEVSKLEQIYKSAEEVVKKYKNEVRDIEIDIENLKREKSTKKSTIESEENEKKTKQTENEKLAVEKVECEKQLDLNLQYKNKYDGIKNEINSINKEIDAAKRKKDQALLSQKNELSPLQSKLKSYDTNDKRMSAMEKQNKLSKELGNSNTTSERKATIKNELSSLEDQIRTYDSNKKLYDEYEEMIKKVNSRYASEIADIDIMIKSHNSNISSLTQELNSVAKQIESTDKRERIGAIDKTISDNLKRIGEIDSTKISYNKRIENITEIIPEKQKELGAARNDLKNSEIQLNDKKDKYYVSVGEYNGEKDKVVKIFESKNVKYPNVNDPHVIELLCDNFNEKVRDKELYVSYCRLKSFDTEYNKYFLNNSYVELFNNKFTCEALNDRLKEVIADVDYFEKNLTQYHNEKIYVDGKHILYTDEKYDTCIIDLKKLSEAENIFKSLCSYKDSEELYKLSIYTQGKVLYDPKPKIALEKFNSIKDYKDSVEWITKCEVLIKERHDALIKKIKIATITVVIIIAIVIVAKIVIK